MILTGENSWFIHQSSLAILAAKKKVLMKEMMNSVL
jgi:hypothetical protein